MFWKNFVELCKEKGMSPNAVCAELNLSNATATKWKQGSTPTSATLNKLAKYFNVSMSRFYEEKEKSPSGIPDRLLKILSENPAKLQLAMLICEWDDEKLSRAIKLLDASLLLPKSDD